MSPERKLRPRPAQPGSARVARAARSAHGRSLRSGLKAEADAAARRAYDGRPHLFARPHPVPRPFVPRSLALTPSSA